MSRGRRLSAAIVLAGALVAAGCSGSGSEDTAKTTTTTVEGGGGTEPPSSTPEGWARSTSDALNDRAPAATLNAILAPDEGGTWAITGTTFDGDGVPRATVWRSRDALQWTATAVGPKGTEGFDAVHRADGALVVVGRQVTGDTSRAAAWVEAGGTFKAAAGGESMAGSAQVAMTTVAARTDGLVAMGFQGNEGKDDTLAVWRSDTGESWQRLPDAENLFAASGRAFVNRVAAVPAGVVALGQIQKGDHVDAAVWFSADGTTWQAAGASPDFGGPGDQRINDVVTQKNGLLAVGSTNDGRRQVPAAWRSDDGKAWAPANATFERQGEASDLFGNEVSSVGALAAGLVATGGGAAAQRIWLSETGANWQEIPLPLNAYAAENFNVDIMATDGSDIVTASTTDGVPRVLLFRSGEWTEVTAKASGFPVPRPSPFFVEVAAAGNRFAASAAVRKAGRALGSERTDSSVFSSGDGLRWDAAKGGRFSRAMVTDLGTDPAGRLVAVGGLLPARTSAAGRTFVTFADVGGTWRRSDVATLPGDPADESGSRHFTGTATRGQRMVLVGNAFVGEGAAGNVDGAIFTKDGAGRLTLVPDVPGLTGPGDETINAVCAGPAGYVVAGSVRNGSELDAGAWFSPDGTTWRQVQSPAFGGAGDQVIEECAATSSGFVAAGSSAAGDESDGAVWTSPDGVAWSRIDTPVLGGDDAQFIDGVAADGAEVVAVGADARSGEYGAALWHSGDAGATWERVDLGKPFDGLRYSVANSAVVVQDRIVVGGIVDGRMAIWSGPWPLRRIS